jgi:glucose-6-phosphate 1-dehydrogenase
MQKLYTETPSYFKATVLNRFFTIVSCTNWRLGFPSVKVRDRVIVEKPFGNDLASAQDTLTVLIS